MNTKLLLLFGLGALSILLSSCDREKDEIVKDPVPVQPVFNLEPLRFDQLAVGQGARFAGLNGENYPSPNSTFSYHRDTLWWEIVGKDIHGFKVKETYYYFDQPANDWFAPDKDSIYYFYINVVDDTLRFKPASSWFFYSRLIGYQIGRQGLPLNTFTGNNIDLVGWKTDLPYCECRKTGFTLNYTQFGRSYPSLNVLLENSAMALDGNGETYVYSPEDGIVRYATYSWWTQSGIGWDLIPE